jgi:hypothetical protein
LVAQAPHRTAYRGLDSLVVYIEARRRLLFARFCDLWRQQEEKATWERLERAAERQLERARERRRAARRAEQARNELAEAERTKEAAAERVRRASAELERADGRATKR